MKIFKDTKHLIVVVLSIVTLTVVLINSVKMRDARLIRETNEDVKANRQIIEANAAMLAERSKDRYTGTQAAEDKARMQAMISELEKRIEKLEGK